MVKNNKNKSQSYKDQWIIYLSIFFIIGWSLLAAIFDLADRLRCMGITNGNCSTDMLGYFLPILPVWAASCVIGYILSAQFKFRPIIAVLLSVVVGFLASQWYAVVSFGLNYGR